MRNSEVSVCVYVYRLVIINYFNNYKIYYIPKLIYGEKIIKKLCC